MVFYYCKHDCEVNSMLAKKQKTQFEIASIFKEIETILAKSQKYIKQLQVQ